ncbi:hypothetical protein [Actibacterium sp. 188UL27-1]|uniref:hypothetical protein n=1 Tax=Actibacterium sp. 188UL27-1 TaxID=2786961 RepID=UPI00195B80FD|nr:hypothetical protein [Actibacterium sp. 188UL27-1]MBM7067290.1 hypothetical protein [Actibacterium sp. 188UL27-1]
MKTIKKVTLLLRRGRDRVYVAELVEMVRGQPDRYLVNYSYGWAESEFTEGTRTEKPVDLETAERLFDSLVLARKNQGYIDQDDNIPWRAETPTGPSSMATQAPDPRGSRLLYLLERAGSMEDSAAARLVWRIGQVRLTTALPLLLELRHQAGPLTMRVLAYALYRCRGDRAADLMPALQAMRAMPDPVAADQARIAEAWLNPPDIVARELRTRLPDRVAAALAEPQDIGVERILGYLASGDAVEHQKTLLDLFMLSKAAPGMRSILLGVLRAVPLKPQLFRAVRRIFKAAEALDDAEVFGCLSRRFDDVPGTYQSKNNYYGYYPAARRKLIENQANENSKLAWSKATRTYFRRRVWRQLRRLGALNDPAYVPMAAACLAEVPADARTDQLDHDNRYTVHKILHGAGTRLQDASTLNWSLLSRADRVATAREEPYANLWDDALEVVLPLLAHSPSQMIQGFAARILLDSPDYCADLAVDLIASLLGHEGQAHAFALKLARDRLVGSADHVRLLIPALLASGQSEATTLAQTVLTHRPDLMTDDSTFAATVLLCVKTETRDWLDEFWTKHATDAALPDLMEQVVAQAARRNWPAETVTDDKRHMRLCVDLLASHFPIAVQQMSGDQLTVLAASSAIPAKLLAILLAAERPDGIARFDPANLADDPDPDIQVAGAVLLAKAAPEQLYQRLEAVLQFLQSPFEGTRDAAVTAVGRLAEFDPGAATRLATEIATILFRKEQEHGVRDSAVLAAQMPAIMTQFVAQGPDQIWKMLRAKAEPARRIGSQALQQIKPDAFSLRKIARIGTNDQQIARRWAVSALEHRLADITAKPQQIFALLDGEWQDSRDAAYDLVRNQLNPGEWQPETIVALCDCTTKPAQVFGREMLGRAFSGENAPLFLQRLSEHPSASFRLTIARLIREHAAGDLDKLRQVKPAILTILSRVFSSRAAKRQTLAFLHEEIASGEPAALEIIGDLLDRLSATCSIHDRAALLELIVQLKSKSPDLIPSAQIVLPELRSGGLA